MSEVLVVRWTILPQEPPKPLLHCKRCGLPRSHGSSGRFRVNANGKRVDAWLIYRCTSCDSTWNRPILERQHLRSLDAGLLASLLSNDPKLADRFACDVETLTHWAPRLEQATQIMMTKEVLSGSTTAPSELQILCVVPCPVSVRVDRLLAEGLQLARSRVQALESSGALAASTDRLRDLRKPVRDGMTLVIRLPTGESDWITGAAAGICARPTGEEASG